MSSFPKLDRKQPVRCDVCREDRSYNAVGVNKGVCKACDHPLSGPSFEDAKLYFAARPATRRLMISAFGK